MSGQFVKTSGHNPSEKCGKGLTSLSELFRLTLHPAPALSGVRAATQSFRACSLFLLTDSSGSLSYTTTFLTISDAKVHGPFSHACNGIWPGKVPKREEYRLQFTFSFTSTCGNLGLRLSVPQHEFPFTFICAYFPLRLSVSSQKKTGAEKTGHFSLP